MASPSPDSPSGLSVFTAAQQLLELSAGWKQNTPGHVTASGDEVKLEHAREKEIRSESSGEGDKPTSQHTLNGFAKPYCHPLKNSKNRVGLVNGGEYTISTSLLCSVDEEEEEEEEVRDHKETLSKVRDIHLPIDEDGSSSVSPSPHIEGGKEEVEDMDIGEPEGMCTGRGGGVWRDT